MNNNYKYQKYKIKYLKKGGMSTINSLEYPNPIALDSYLIKLDESQIIPDYIDETNFLKSNGNSKIIDCKYKVSMLNFFNTCWFIAITIMFFFSDKTRESSQLNLFPIIKQLKQNRLTDKQIILLKKLYFDEFDFIFEIDNIFKNKLYKLFSNIYKNLFQMIQCKIGYKKSCDIDVLHCPISAISQLFELFFHDNKKDISDNILEKIKKNTHILITNDESNLSIVLKLIIIYIKFYSIILLESNLYVFKINNINQLDNENIVGYFIFTNEHVYCIFKCNGIYYKCDNHKIEEINMTTYDFTNKDIYVVLLIDNIIYHEIYNLFIKIKKIDMIIGFPIPIHDDNNKSTINGYTIYEIDVIKKSLIIIFLILINENLKNIFDHLNNGYSYFYTNILSNFIFIYNNIKLFSSIIEEITCLYLLLYIINFLRLTVFTKKINLLNDEEFIKLYNQIFNSLKEEYENKKSFLLFLNTNTLIKKVYHDIYLIINKRKNLLKLEFTNSKINSEFNLILNKIKSKYKKIILLDSSMWTTLEKKFKELLIL